MGRFPKQCLAQKSHRQVQVNLFQELATSAEHVVYQKCSECQNKQKSNFCTQHVLQVLILSLQFSRTMNNLSSYCGLVDAKIRASDKNLPVKTKSFELN